MISYIVRIGTLPFAIVNLPVSSTTILLNMFFIYCMLFSQKGPATNLKPPLNVLLWSVIACSLILNCFNLLFVLYDFVYPAPWLYIFSAASILFAMRAGFTSTLGLHFCYFLQIVPVRLSFLIWMKKHMRLLVYLALFMDRLFFLFEFLTQIVFELQNVEFAMMNLTGVYANGTTETADITYYIAVTDFWLRCSYYFFCIIIMMASSTATVFYLRKHAKRMEENTKSLSAHHQRQQMRVTIMGIIQIVLFFSAAGFLVGEELTVYFVDSFDWRGHLASTVMCLYSFGASILLGFGQSRFRLTAKDIGRKLQTLNCPFP